MIINEDFNAFANFLTGFCRYREGKLAAMGPIVDRGCLYFKTAKNSWASVAISATTPFFVTNTESIYPRVAFWWVGRPYAAQVPVQATETHRILAAAPFELNKFYDLLCPPKKESENAKSAKPEEPPKPWEQLTPLPQGNYVVFQEVGRRVSDFFPTNTRWGYSAPHV